jgi:hypothetical protein
MLTADRAAGTAGASLIASRSGMISTCLEGADTRVSGAA